MTSERLSRVCEWLLYRVNYLCNWAKAALLCAAQAQWRRPGPAGLEADQRHRRDYATRRTGTLQADTGSAKLRRNRKGRG